MTRPLMKRADRWPWVWAAIVTVLLVAVAGFAIAYLHAASVATCVNTVLAARDEITGQIHAADVDRVEGQRAAERVKSDGLNQLARATTQAEGIAGFRRYTDGERQFTKTLVDYINESNRLRAEQLKHPLGQC